MAELRQAPPRLLGRVHIFSGSLQTKAAQVTGSLGYVQWWLGWSSLLCIDEFAPSAFCKGGSIFCRRGSRGRVQNRPDPDAGMGSRCRACPALWLLMLALPHTG